MCRAYSKPTSRVKLPVFGLFCSWITHCGILNGFLPIAFRLQIAAQANAKRPKDEQIHLSAHLLRHTLLRRAAEKKGVHYAMELSGHLYRPSS